MNEVTMWMDSALQFILGQKLHLLLPETIVLTMIVGIVLLLSFGRNEEEREYHAWFLSAVGCLMTVVVLGVFFVIGLNTGNAVNIGVDVQSGLDWGALAPQKLVTGVFQPDLFSILIRLILALGTLFVICFSRQFMKTYSEVPGEFYVILLSALLGGMLLSGAKDLLMAFVALETLGISSYIMVGYFRNEEHSAEAALKYLIYGGMSTAILLFGFSLLYGLSGSTDFTTIAMYLQNVKGEYPLLAMLSVMVIGGFCFKLSAAPFHMWAPDVYEGAPTPVTAFLSVVSKVAGFSIAMRFLSLLLGNVSGLFAVIAGISVLSMVIGNVVALTQRNIKRLLAYSTIAHAGYMLLGLTVLSTPDLLASGLPPEVALGVTQQGMSSVLYYLVAYLFMNIGAFAVVVHFSNITGGRDDIAAFAGLVRKRPTLALAFTLLLLGLAGMPITSGFFAKFFLFQAVAQAGSQHVWLVMIALLTSTVSLYYYLNVVRLMVIAEPSDAVENLQPEPALMKGPLVGAQALVTITLAICVYMTVVMGLIAEPFMGFAHTAVQEMARLSNPRYMFSQLQPALPKAAELSYHSQR